MMEIMARMIGSWSVLAGIKDRDQGQGHGQQGIPITHHHHSPSPSPKLWYFKDNIKSFINSAIMTELMARMIGSWTSLIYRMNCGFIRMMMYEHLAFNTDAFFSA